MTGDAVPGTDRLRAVELFVRDGTFARLWSLCNERFVSWEEFSALEMPDGTDAERVWGIVSDLRRLTGRRIPTPLQPIPWCNLPLDEQRTAWDLLARSDTASFLDEYVHAKPFRQIDVQDQVDELVACLDRDGCAVGYESVRGIVVGNRRPLVDYEKVVDAYCRILEDEMLGAGNRLLAANELYDGLVESLDTAPAVDSPAAMQVLSKSLARAGRGDALETIIFSAHLFENPSWTHPVSAWNAVFGSLLRKVYFVRCGRSVLSFLPLSKAMFEDGSRSLRVSCEVSLSLHPGLAAGREGSLCAEGADGLSVSASAGWICGRNAHPELWDEKGEYYDLTPYFVIYLQKVSACLDVFEHRVQEDERHEDALRSLVRSTYRLNHRQRDTVLACLADPNITFDYETYRDAYQVAYATARADLTDLANLALLRSEVHGKRTVVYRVPDDLRRVVEERLR